MQLNDEPALITMILFLYSYHASFWEPNFQWLKMIDPASKVSGYCSRHVSARAFAMHAELQNMSRLWSSTDGFIKFNERRSLRAGQEFNMLFKTLPEAFLNDAMIMFNKHFVRQWLSNKLLPLALAAMPPASAAFARWLLNLPVEDKTVRCDLHKKSTRLPSLIAYATKDASLNDLKEQIFFAKCSTAIAKIAQGSSSFDADDDNALDLQQHVKLHWIPLPSATQLVELKAKDASFCKSTGKSEWSASNIAMMRSLSILMVASAIKESDRFKNRVRRNEEAKDFLRNQPHNAEALAANFCRINELNVVPVEDIECSKIALSKNNHCHCKRQQGTIDKYALSKIISKRPNAAMKISGVERTPLLLSQVQIGTIHSTQRELLMEELMLRGLITNQKELITRLKKMLIDNEHPGETDANKKKHLCPRFLTATDWQRDRLDDTLAKINETRLSRDRTV